MSGKRRTPGYFAVARTIFDHPLFNYGQHRYSRREAWEYLIAEAAYQPAAHRHVLGITPLQRGQLTLTMRELAAKWRWPATNVHRFLHRLEREEMVVLERSGTNTGTKVSPYRQIITICNYDKFQIGRPRAGEQTAEQTHERDAPQLPGFAGEIATPNRQPLESEARGSAKGRGEPLQPVNNGDKYRGQAEKAKPPHGVKSRDKRVQWFDYGTEEWREAAEFDRVERNIVTLPVSYANGRGNWFRCRTLEEWQGWGRKRLAQGR